MVTYPKDWTQYSFRDFLKIKRGASPRPIEYYLTNNANGVNWIKIGDAPKSGKYIVSTKERITEAGASCSVRVYPHDFLLSNSMSFGRPYILDVEGCIHDGWLRLFDFQDTADDDYLYYLLSSDFVQDQYKSYAAGSGVQNLNKEVVKKVVVWLPSLPEQKAIAKTLSCMDEHIANLTELIEKKKGIRDGALEDLVSGRTRLSGFYEEWKEKSLKEICKVFDGTHQTPKYTHVGIRFVSVENIRSIYLSEKYISKQDYERDFSIKPERNDILMTRIGDIGTPCIVTLDEPIAFYVSLALLKSIQINSVFLYYYIQGKAFQKQLDDRALNQAIPKKINKGEIGKCLLRYPKDTHEQESIAAILSSMDVEIAALEEEKDKMLQIRAGAMDDLLTGRVRLTRQGG